MEATQLPSLADRLRTLPAQGASRDRQIHRLVDTYASTEAATALQDAIGRTGPGILARVLVSADAAMRDPNNDVARDFLRDTVSAPEFLALVPGWIRVLREIASSHPNTGACTLASAFELWMWTVQDFRLADEPQALDELSEALYPLLASRALVLEVAMLNLADEALRADLCHSYAARVSAATGSTCAELVFGYRRHLKWDPEGCASCFAGDDVDALEGLIPGMAAGMRASGDVVESDGWHPPKAGPCARLDGLDAFLRLRRKLDGCLTGARIARNRAAASISHSMALATSSRTSERRA